MYNGCIFYKKLLLLSSHRKKFSNYSKIITTINIKLFSNHYNYFIYTLIVVTIQFVIEASTHSF